MGLLKKSSGKKCPGHLVMALLAIALMCGGCTRSPKPRPGRAPRNVLLVTMSALRTDHLSAYMYARPTTAWPATEEERRLGRALSLDDLAEQGVLFADASSGAPRTFPALCSLMTGARTAAASDAEGDRALESEATTLAESFRTAGFKTAAFTAGQWLREPRGLEQGFDTVVARFSDSAILDLSRQWLEAAEEEPERPWFLWVHFAGGEPPHDPRGLPPLPGGAPGVLDFSRLYTAADYSGPADGSIAHLARLARGEVTADARDRAQVLDRYDGEVARLNSSLRTLVLALRNLNESGSRWNDTVFVFAGLHGIEFGERDPRAWGSDSLAASVLSVPLILRHPGSLTGSRVMGEPVGLEDIGPTLCDWFGLPALSARENSRMGRSLLALLDTYVQREFVSRPAYAERTGKNPERALRTREYAIVERVREGVRSFAVFDRIADPAELVDLAPQRPELLAELRAALERETFGTTP